MSDRDGQGTAEGRPRPAPGLRLRREEPRLPAELVAAILSVLWLLVAGGAVLFSGDAPEVQGLLLAAVLILVPIALFWIAASAARTGQIMHEEAARLHGAIDALRHTALQASTARAPAPDTERMERKLAEIADAQKKTESAIATFASSRARAVPGQGGAAAPEQPALALEPDAEPAPALSRADYIRALNFPRTAEDSEGFAALRRALARPETVRLVRAAEDVLTLLSQDGIYMDDLTPDRARPEVWRRFAAGTRGAAIAGLGGVRDRSCLSLAAGRMREDAIFRDAAHHFLREFDRGVSAFIAEAGDEEIAALAETRSARAFMLLGRVAGTFD